jgi:hypothetical protein
MPVFACWVQCPLPSPPASTHTHSKKCSLFVSLPACFLLDLRLDIEALPVKLFLSEHSPVLVGVPVLLLFVALWRPAEPFVGAAAGRAPPCLCSAFVIMAGLVRSPSP